MYLRQGTEKHNREDIMKLKNVTDVAREKKKRKKDGKATLNRKR